MRNQEFMTWYKTADVTGKISELESAFMASGTAGVHVDSRLDAVCRAYEIKIGILEGIIETYDTAMGKIQAELLEVPR
jgi:hypothetical protein